MSNVCPSCSKKVYFAERQSYKGTDYHQLCYNILIKKEAAAAPKTFAIHEQIFCNTEENSKFKYPLAPAGGYIVPQEPPKPSSPTPSSPKQSPPSPSSSSSSPPKSRGACTKCSKEVKPTDKFCSSCGTKLV